MSCVQVWCRVKPPTSGSAEPVAPPVAPPVYCSGSGQLTVEVSGGGPLPGAGAGYRQQFQLDHAFPADSSQEDIFEQLQPRVREFLQGYSATVLTYGQTGSGKTFTIQGGEAAGSEGVVPRVADMVFRHCCEGKAEGWPPDGSPHAGRTQVSVSFLEIYQEQLKDLLQKPAARSSAARGLRIRETSKAGIWVEGLTEKLVCSKEEFSELFLSAALRRSVGSHAMNSESSRSHLLCTLTLRQPASSGSGVLSSKFHLVDLAGSEMVRKTDASGERLNEAKHINKSLSALGNVISALTGGSGEAVDSSASGLKRHIPYRDSKLTRILQDSLAGNSKTTLILTVSSSASSLQETIATLRFGERARKLTTKPRLNLSGGPGGGGRDLGAETARLREALLQAQQEIMRLTEIIADVGTEPSIAHAPSSRSPLVGHAGADSSDGVKGKCQYCGGLGGGLGEPPSGCDVSKWNDRGDNMLDRNEESGATTALTHGAEMGETMRLWESGVDNHSNASRCAVCGLTEAEGNALDQNLFLVDASTASHLHSNGLSSADGMGALFTCDGNCGHYFHPRCVGIPVSQEGEWFCIDCSNIMQEESMSDGMASSCTADTLLAPSASVLSRVTKQYHVMRLERNRLMLNWQQERRMAKMRADKDSAAQQQKETEREAALLQCKLLREELQKEQRETARLRKSRDQEFNLRVILEKEANRSPVKDDAVPQKTQKNSRAAKSDRSPTAGGRVSLLSSNSMKELSPPEKSPDGAALPASVSSDALGIPKPWLSTKQASRDFPPQSPLQLKSPTTSSPDQGRPDGSVDAEREKRRMQVSPIRPSPENRKANDSSGASNVEQNDDVPSAYLFPIRNRLKDLLRSVELEAGSFAEIRNKQKERELLRTSHVSRRGNGARMAASIDASDASRNSIEVEAAIGQSFDSSDAVSRMKEGDNKLIFRTFAPTSRRRKGVDKTSSPADAETGPSADKNSVMLSTTFPSIVVKQK